MGDKDFLKPLLERRGTVFFGKVGQRGSGRFDWGGAVVVSGGQKGGFCVGVAC